MGFMTEMKIRSALTKQQKGKREEALAIYEELYQQGVVKASYMLPFSTILLKKGGTDNFERVKEILKKAQKAPDLDTAYRIRLFVNYSAAEYKLGDIQGAVANMENIAQKHETGDIYTVLGYLYIEAGNLEKALEFNQKGLEYDDEDPMVLDNLGQTYYRLAGDKETARAYFEKAIALKNNQIDTLWFLSRYDVEEGKTKAAIEKLETALEGNFSVLNHVTREEVEAEIARLKSL